MSNAVYPFGVTSIAGWFISWKICKLYKWMIWGYPYFEKPPFNLFKGKHDDEPEDNYGVVQFWANPACE
jgi:hypothetical protein